MTLNTSGTTALDREWRNAHLFRLARPKLRKEIPKETRDAVWRRVCIQRGINRLYRTLNLACGLQFVDQTEVLTMRHVVHVRRSFDIGGQHFVVRLYPEFRPEERRSESFTSAESMVKRLVELGVEKVNNAAESFPPGGGVLDAIWTNVEVPQETLESFGKGVSYRAVAA